MTTNEYDVVIVGSGAAGLSAAIHAHDLGLSVVILEAYKKYGGATAFSGGQVWAGENHVMAREGMADSMDETRQYVKSINHDADVFDEEIFEQWVTQSPRVLEGLEKRGDVKWTTIHGFPDYEYPASPGSKPEGRYLTAAPICGDTLGELRSKLLVSPHHPPGPSYDEIYAQQGDVAKTAALFKDRTAKDIMTMGTGLVVHLLGAVARRGIPMLLNHRVKKVTRTDAGDVTGVLVDTPSGEAAFEGTVILATGAYDWNWDLVRQHSGLLPDESGSVAPPGVRGDGLLLAHDLGVPIIQLPLKTALHLPGYPAVKPDEEKDDNGFRYSLEMALPHSLLVDSTAKRFSDDSYYHSIVDALATGKGKSPFYLIWDENRRQKYPLSPVQPGEAYPETMQVESAPTVGELAVKLGLDPETLSATVERFSKYAKDGEDPDFHRGTNIWTKVFLGDAKHEINPVLGPVERAPFFGMRMRLVNTGIGVAGIKAGLDGQVIHSSGRPIKGLFAAGVVTAPLMCGSGYNSGYSICRGLVFGALAAERIQKDKARGGK